MKDLASPKFNFVLYRRAHCDMERPRRARILYEKRIISLSTVRSRWIRHQLDIRTTQLEGRDTPAVVVDISNPSESRK